MKTVHESRLVLLGLQVAGASTVEDACALAAQRLSAALRLPCLVRIKHDGGAETIAAAGRAVSEQELEQGTRISIGDIGGVTRELVIVAERERIAGNRRDDVRAEARPSEAERSGVELVKDAIWRETLAGVLAMALQLVAFRSGRSDVSLREKRLDRFSRALVDVADGPALHKVIVEYLARAVDAQIGALAIYNPQEHSLAVTATFGYPSVVVEHVRLGPGEGVLGRVFASGQPLLVKSASDPTGLGRRRRYRTDSYVALPLSGTDGVMAVVSFTDKTDGSAFNDEDLALLASLAVPASLAVSRELLRDRTNDLAHLATVDALTGLFNRRYFETRLEQEIQRQRRQFDELALLLVDLDNFKELNDSQGHLVGDRVLREVAEILRRAVRIFDVCARYGGEEFVILMPGANAQTALRIAERIRRQVEQHFASGLRFGAPSTLTVSVGVSTAAANTTRETLIAQADWALLRAKSSGKNVVNLHQASGV